MAIVKQIKPGEYEYTCICGNAVRLSDPNEGKPLLSRCTECVWKGRYE